MIWSVCWTKAHSGRVGLLNRSATAATQQQRTARHRLVQAPQQQTLCLQPSSSVTNLQITCKALSPLVPPPGQQTPMSSPRHTSSALPRPSHGGGGKAMRPAPAAGSGVPPVSAGMLRGAWPGSPWMTIPVGWKDPGMPGAKPAPRGCTDADTGGSCPGLIHSPAAARV